MNKIIKKALEVDTFKVEEAGVFVMGVISQAEHVELLNSNDYDEFRQISVEEGFVTLGTDSIGDLALLVEDRDSTSELRKLRDEIDLIICKLDKLDDIVKGIIDD